MIIIIIIIITTIIIIIISIIKINTSVINHYKYVFRHQVMTSSGDSGN